MVRVDHEVSVFDRLGHDAARFGIATPDDPLELVGRGRDGWWAFAPGTAQAANVGPFRWRWLPPEAGIPVSACPDLPVVSSPPAGVCFEMALGDVPVRAAPDPGAAVLVTLPSEGYARAVTTGAGGWLQVDTSVGSLPEAHGRGWVAPGDIDVNGPCDEVLAGR